MRHSLKKFSRGNDPKTSMGIGQQEYAERWLDEHKLSYNLEDFKEGKDGDGNTTIEVLVDRNSQATGYGKRQVKITFTF